MLGRIVNLFCFSALQRAENSSILLLPRQLVVLVHVSVLFSEPKIPQSSGGALGDGRAEVSVLFSEPKIPQCPVFPPFRLTPHQRFSALQRAENSSIQVPLLGSIFIEKFQCSSASRKFLNPDPRTCVHPYFRPR